MDDPPCCPLCTEELDASDLGFFPCRCRFQVCPFCYGRLKEGGGLCPGCRAPYKDQEPIYEKPDLEKLRQQREQVRQREREEKQHASKTLDSLANVRVIQRNLVYVTGLPLKHAYDDVLAGPKWFKPYGKILKCVANRSVQYNSNSPYGPTVMRARALVSAYVTYSRHEEALEAIKRLDNTMQDGHNLRCSFGTTKYCNNFLRGQECTNPDCMYLHKVQEDDDTYLRAQLSRNQDSRSRSEFHDKTHPQFQELSISTDHESDHLPPQQHQPLPAQNHTTEAGVPLPAPLPPTRAAASTIAGVAAAPAVPAQSAPAPSDPVAAQIPVPRPVRPQVGPPSGGGSGLASAPSLPFESSAPISAPGSAPWSSAPAAPAPQPPHHPHEQANAVYTMDEPSQKDPVHNPSNSARNVDPVASAANAALSTNSLFSAFANSQAAPGPEPNLGLWPSTSETNWQTQPSTNSVFGGSNFSLWGDSPGATNGVSSDPPIGLGATHDLWGTSIGTTQPASNSQSFVAPPSHQPQKQASSQPAQQQADWQSAFRALLPDVNVHFEGGSQQAPPASSCAPSAPASANIWGASSSDTNIIQNQGNNGLTWNLPAMLQPSGLPQPQVQPALSNPSSGMDSLYQQGAQWSQTIGGPTSQPTGNNNSNNSRKSKGGKKKGKRN